MLDSYPSTKFGVNRLSFTEGQTSEACALTSKNAIKPNYGHEPNMIHIYEWPLYTRAITWESYTWGSTESDPFKQVILT